MKFMGYVRPDGSVGIRNYMLVLAAARAGASLAEMIAKNLTGAKLYIPPQDGGRNSEDRAAIAGTVVGLGKNANVGAVLVVGLKRNGGYPEFTYENIVGEIAKSGKPYDTVFLDECGGLYNGIGEGLRKGRDLLIKCSEAVREEVDFGRLYVGVKCGYSDGTSGLAGNPVVGNMFERLVGGGGKGIFGETTEVIGAEHILAKRFSDPKQGEKFLAAVKRVEEEALATGEDIRTINPVPANIEAGLTTIEEKSLGAIAKAGKLPMGQCVRYAEPPKGPGMHFMDTWMSSTAIFLGFTGSGTVLNIFQMGGGWMAKGSLLPSGNTGVIAPTLFMTGNTTTYEKCGEEMDFDASPVMRAGEPIADAGRRLCELICKIGSGRMTKAETLGTQEPTEVYMRGPGL